MQEDLNDHFSELNADLNRFMSGKVSKWRKFERGYTYLERHSLDSMIKNYIVYFNRNVKEEGDGFASDWDSDDWMSILYKDGTIRQINPQEDDGTRRIKLDGIDSIIVEGSWGTAFAGPHVQLYNLRETTDYGKWGYKDIEQRYLDDDDIRVDFDV